MHGDGRQPDTRRVLVTGGAGGIGRACADLFLAEGMEVVVTDLPGALAELAPHPRLTAVPADVTSAGEVAALAERLGTVDALVNAAGILQDIVSLAELGDAEHRLVWEVNYWGTFHCCRSFGAGMARRGGGAIVNVSSINAFRGTPLLAYAPGKAAINALTVCLAGELGPAGVRVNAVAPGFTLTRKLRDKLDAGLRNPVRIVEAAALRRFVEPEEVAQAVAFLVSDRAAAITGVCLPVDAGWLATAHRGTFGGPTVPSPA